MEEISTDDLKNRDETDQGTRSVTPEQLENNESTRKIDIEKPDPDSSQNLGISCFDQGQLISKEVSVQGLARLKIWLVTGYHWLPEF